MPHLIAHYSGNLDADTDMTALCRALADAMMTVRDDEDAPVFPTGGLRVLAYAAPHFAIADGTRDYAFLYLNLRMGRGRSEAVRQRAGEAILAAARAHLDPLFESRLIGLTLQVDEGPEVFDAKYSNIHPLFRQD